MGLFGRKSKDTTAGGTTSVTTAPTVAICEMCGKSASEGRGNANIMWL